MFQSTKLIDGFSTCFRQFSAEDTHCKFLHGYSISFKVIFEGPLDKRNWVVDFGFMKRARTVIRVDHADGGHSTFTPDGWFKWMFDHTVVIDNRDPEYYTFQELHEKGVLQLRVVGAVGCEMFAKLVFDTLQKFLDNETDGRVRVVSVECFEHEKNSAIYSSNNLE